MPLHAIETPAPPALSALHVIALTASAWHVAPASARAIARRAPHGYVPRRAIRRLRGVAALGPLGPGFFAHSW